MKKIILGLSLALMSSSALAVDVTDFELVSQTGEKVKLSDYADKTVVLEWTNFGCPFVRKHYDSKNMQSLQNKWNEETVWLSIVSSAPGKQGYLADASAAKEAYDEEASNSDFLLLDPTGEVGKAYGAKTTPHMFVIRNNEVVYHGGIDSIPTPYIRDIEKAENYVDVALNEIQSGKPVTTGYSQPYGCSVKY